MRSMQSQIVIVGGGSAGWLTAGVLASEFKHTPDINITLIESSDVPTIGVGEGTWPSMRATLERIGLSENALIQHCNATFKQGSLFRQWRNNSPQDRYHHPFTAPQASNQFDLAPHWLPFAEQVPFAFAMSTQPAMIEAGRGPKNISTPQYAFVQNYGYHLDAGKFVSLLKQHCVTQLGVRHIVDNVTDVVGDKDDVIQQVMTEKNGAVCGELFIDCSGFAALLIEKHYGIKLHKQDHVLFNDNALAVQVPYAADDTPIASATLSTAQTAGWIWDIGLQTRRGVGYVYSSAHSSSDEAMQTLDRYLGGLPADSRVREIPIVPGYREVFWHHNCVAVGLSAGFIEPLEASALVLIELAASFIAEQLPFDSHSMKTVSQRYNQTFTYRWQRIIEFLKLHYVLSSRDDSDYWRDNRAASSQPESLQALLALWQTQCPSRYDFPMAEEMFPAASYQYIYYGMGGQSHLPPKASIARYAERAMQEFSQVRQQSANLARQLPSHRELIEKIAAYGLQKI
ncbi:tryptophan halogenase family protein [Bowmanella sp. JS7-9]|uniref:Tryptophan halogenase family protein n=1 Tax=Pseudobowmanella zhangzhouensis TaxID=1537679 RepID=A0ABW1XJJ9_9ALTE|nr:tryptophan halogenase family protein [Bowmanella sp. JS7-9]TBX25774.1 tryptophan halogenase [Bowmanella sp. JS7-9]